MFQIILDVMFKPGADNGYNFPVHLMKWSNKPVTVDVNSKTLLTLHVADIGGTGGQQLFRRYLVHKICVMGTCNY